MNETIPVETLLRPSPGNGSKSSDNGGNGNGASPFRPVSIEVPIGPPFEAASPILTADPRGRLGKKARLLKAHLTGRPVWVTWQVTYNCNYGCSFCTYWQNDFKPHEENSLQDFALGSKKLSEMGSLIVSMAGGEPMLRRDIHQIIEIVAQDHFPYMTTSGSGVTPRRARQIWEAGCWGVSVSIDYADPARHDEHRGVKYAYRRAITAIEQLLETRTDPSYQRVQIISVLTDDNQDQMEDLCALAADLGVYWQVQPYSVMKTGEEERRHLPGATDLLLGLKERYPDTFHANKVYLEKFEEAVNDGIEGCIAGRGMFNVDNRMVVSKCVEFNESEPCGNLRTDSMSDVLERLHMAHESNTCTACWYSCRGEVEVLYTPRGFYHSMHSFLYQSRGQKG